MADIRDTQSNVEKLDDRTRNQAAGEISIDSSRLGVYDRPNSTTNARNGAIRIIILLVSLLVLVYVLLRWLA